MHEPVQDFALIAGIITLEVTKVVMEIVLVDYVSESSYKTILYESLPFYFVPWYIISTLFRIYFFTSFAILTEVDSNMSESLIVFESVFRYFFIVLFYLFAISFPYSLSAVMNNETTKGRAMVPIWGSLVALGCLVFGHVAQVLVPGGLDSSCECWVRTVSITSFLAGVLALPLYIFDVCWGNAVYRNRKDPYVTMRNDGSFVEEKVELTLSDEYSI